MSPYFKLYVVGRTVLLAILTAFIYLIATLILKDQVSFLMTDIIKTMAKVSILAIFAVELWDRYSDRLEVFQNTFGDTGIFAGVYYPLSALARYGVVIVLMIGLVGVLTGGYTLPVVLIGIFIGSYIVLPSTGEDYWVLIAWIACVAMVLITGLMTFSEIVEYQTFTYVPMITKLLGGI
jgi:hypothetical protein